jgi:hypothetical protein
MVGNLFVTMFPLSWGAIGTLSDAVRLFKCHSSVMQLADHRTGDVGVMSSLDWQLRNWIASVDVANLIP